MNRRAEGNYRFLKNKIPNDYDINYYLLSEYPGADVMCIIKKKGYEYGENYNPTTGCILIK